MKLCIEIEEVEKGKFTGESLEADLI